MSLSQLPVVTGGRLQLLTDGSGSGALIAPTASSSSSFAPTYGLHGIAANMSSSSSSASGSSISSPFSVQVQFLSSVPVALLRNVAPLAPGPHLDGNSSPTGGHYSSIYTAEAPMSILPPGCRLYGTPHIRKEEAAKNGMAVTETKEKSEDEALAAASSTPPDLFVSVVVKVPKSSSFLAGGGGGSTSAGRGAGVDPSLTEFFNFLSLPPHPNILPLLGLCPDWIDPSPSSSSAGNKICCMVAERQKCNLREFALGMPKWSAFSRASSINEEEDDEHDGSQQFHTPQHLRRDPLFLLQILHQMSLALKHFHDYSRIHRDVALRNFLCSANNMILLADFGLSRVIKTASASNNASNNAYTNQSQMQHANQSTGSALQSRNMASRHNASNTSSSSGGGHGSLVSTSSAVGGGSGTYDGSHDLAHLPLRWLAPECLLSHRFGFASDVYAFGVSGWELITQATEQPYEEFFRAIQLQQQQQQSHTHPNQSSSNSSSSTTSQRDNLTTRMFITALCTEEIKLNFQAKCSPQLEDLLLQCLSVSPSRRPTMVNVVQRIEAIIKDSYPHVYASMVANS